MIAQYILYIIPFVFTVWFGWTIARVWERNPKEHGAVAVTFVMFGVLFLIWWWATFTVVGRIF